MIKEDIRIDDQITLGSIRKKDFPVYVQLLNDPKIYENTLTIPYPYHISDAQRFYKIAKSWEDEHKIKREWQIRLDQDLIGGIGLVYAHGPAHHNTNIGYWVGKNYRDKGIMSKVLKVFIPYIFEKRSHLARIGAQVYPQNIASQRVLEKNGFVKEGYFRFLIKKDERFMDVLQYATFNPTIA